MKNTRSINSKTKIFAIIGNPLTHTLSPLMHNGLFQHYDLDALYLVAEMTDPGQQLPVFEQIMPLKGLSVTIPHKEWAYRYAQYTDENSGYMQAANTLIWQENGIHAYNTDGPGALSAIENVLPTGPQGDILIIGNGGSARGILYTLIGKKWPGKIYLAARNITKAEALLEKISSLSSQPMQTIALTEVEKIRDSVELVVQTTPVGMKNATAGCVISADFFHEKHWLFDIVYNPLQTALVVAASQRGSKIIPGYEMLLYQGMEQFYRFTGIQPDRQAVSLVRDWLEKALNKKL